MTDRKFQLYVISVLSRITKKKMSLLDEEERMRRSKIGPLVVEIVLLHVVSIQSFHISPLYCGRVMHGTGMSEYRCTNQNGSRYSRAVIRCMFNNRRSRSGYSSGDEGSDNRDDDDDNDEADVRIGNGSDDDDEDADDDTPRTSPSNVKEVGLGEDEDEDETKPYGNRSKAWSRRYRKLLPYEYARRRAIQLGLHSKQEWDAYIADGELEHGPYLPILPEEMYQEDWVSWEEFLGCMRSYDEARHIVRNILKLSSMEQYELFIRADPERAAGLRLPLEPAKIYHDNGWISADHFLGIDIPDTEA